MREQIGNIPKLEKPWPMHQIKIKGGSEENFYIFVAVL